MIELSVVLISKNQEWNIARLVESVLRETDPLPAREIVLVDSASTDRTTEIAARYPIAVLKLYPEQRLTAAAGRYVGYKRTTGDLVLFLDGDMELCEGWLDQALGVMHSRPDVAVVCGRVIDRPSALQTPTVEHLEALDTDAAGIDVRHGGGAAMYRRSVLERVGTFNPYLYSDEEPELCLRIRHAGYRVLRLPRPIVFHYSAPADAFSTLLGRRSRNLWLGYGQNIRYLSAQSAALAVSERTRLGSGARFDALHRCSCFSGIRADWPMGVVGAVGCILDRAYDWNCHSKTQPDARTFEPIQATALSRRYSAWLAAKTV